MKLDKELLGTMPDIMNKERFRVVCHISKRTALCYLQSGLIRAENTGKKTHIWNIRKTISYGCTTHTATDENHFQKCKSSIKVRLECGAFSRFGRDFCAIIFILSRKVSSYFAPVRTMFEIRLIRKCSTDIFPKTFDIFPKTD